MSELEAFESERIYWAVEQVERVAGDIDGLHLDDNLFYIKSEADKVTAYQKYKRCLDKAERCAAECVVNQNTYRRFFTHKSKFRIGHFRKWYFRWLKIAEQFKEVIK